MSETDYAEIFDEDYDFDDEDLDEEMEEETEGDAAEETAEEGADTEISGGDPAEAGMEGRRPLAEETQGVSQRDVPDNNAGNNGQTANDPEGVGTVNGPQGGFDPVMQAAIRAEAQKQIDAFVEREFAGVVNPFTKAPIRTQADLQAYRQAFQEEQNRQQLQEMGVSKEMLDNYIQNHPAMRQAQQVIRQQQQVQADAFMENEFKALKREFPDCGFDSPRALHATEAGKKALQMWVNTPGVTLADAYAATHRAEISKRQSAAVKQAAMNEMSSKGHLKQTKVSGAKGGAEMPADVLKGYREIFRDATDEEIRAMWEKNQKY